MEIIKEIENKDFENYPHKKGLRLTYYSFPSGEVMRLDYDDGLYKIWPLQEFINILKKDNQKVK